MKYLALVALIGVLLGTPHTASASPTPAPTTTITSDSNGRLPDIANTPASTPSSIVPVISPPLSAKAVPVTGYISQDRSVLVLIPTRKGLPIGMVNQTAKKGESWFALKNGHGWIQYTTTTTGVPTIPDPSTMIADVTGLGTAGMRYDNSGFLEVNVAAGTVTVTLPFAGNADAQAGASSGQGVGIFAWNGSTWDRLTDDGSKNLNVDIQAINASITTIPRDALTASSFTTLTSTGCAGTPCNWGALSGAHTLYSVTFVAAVGMTTAGDNLTAYDNTTNVQDATHVLLMSAAQMGAAQTWTPAGDEGLHLTFGLYFVLAGSRVLNGGASPTEVILIGYR